MIQQSVQVTGRKPSFLDSSLKIDGILDILHVIAQEPKTMGEIHSDSKISMKNSVVKYVKYCNDKGFVTTYTIELRRRQSFSKTRTAQNYRKYHKVTDKGRIFLEMFQ